MKRLRALALVLACCTVAVLYAADASDNFSVGTALNTTNWQTSASLPCPNFSSGSQPLANTGAFCRAYWKVDSFANDQFSQVTTIKLAGTVTTSFVYEFLLRATWTAGDGSDLIGYAIQLNRDTRTIYKCPSGAGSCTSMASGSITSWTDGDVLRVTMVSNAITVRNVTTATDLSTDTDGGTPIASGHPGLGGFSDYTGATYGIADWTGGPIAGGGGSQPNHLTLLGVSH